MTENTTASCAADTTYKLGNEFLPFHPSASHIEPAYRDGWNACYKAAIAASAPVAPIPTDPGTDAKTEKLATKLRGVWVFMPEGSAADIVNEAVNALKAFAAAPKAAPRSFQPLFDKMHADPGHDALLADVLAGGNGAPLQQGEYLPLPIGEGTVYCNPDGSLMIDASLAFFDGAKIGDKLYTADQVCAAIDADRAARGAAQAAPAPVAEDAEDGARFRAMVNAAFTGFDAFERIMHDAAAETEPETIDDFRALIDKARVQAAQPEGGVK